MIINFSRDKNMIFIVVIFQYFFPIWTIERVSHIKYIKK